MLGGYVLPGIVTVKAPEFEAKIDSKEAKGANGNKISFDGVKAAESEIEIVVWTADQYTEMVELLSDLKPPDGKGAPLPWDVIYPFFNDMGVNTLIVTKIEGPGFGKMKGTYEAKIKVKEWRADWAKPGSGTPTTSKTAVPAVSTVFDNAVATSGVVDPKQTPPPTATPMKP